MRNHEPKFNDRLNAAAKAKRALLDKARANGPADDPDFAERQAARREVAIAREARAAERKAAKLAEKTRLAEEKAAEEAARAIALAAEREAREAEATEQAAREIALEAERKAARDVRYAARKARKR